MYWFDELFREESFVLNNSLMITRCLVVLYFGFNSFPPLQLLYLFLHFSQVISQLFIAFSFLQQRTTNGDHINTVAVSVHVC